MKKILPVLTLIGVLAVLVVPLVTSAQQIPECCQIRRTFDFEGVRTQGHCYGAATGTCVGYAACVPATSFTDERWGMICILNTVYRVTDLVFGLLIVFGAIMILLAAYTFLTAGGAPEKVNKARDYILYALVGLTVAFLARAIPSIVRLLI